MDLVPLSSKQIHSIQTSLKPNKGHFRAKTARSMEARQFHPKEKSTRILPRKDFPKPRTESESRRVSNWSASRTQSAASRLDLRQWSDSAGVVWPPATSPTALDRVPCPFMAFSLLLLPASQRCLGAAVWPRGQRLCGAKSGMNWKSRSTRVKLKWECAATN